MLNVVEVNEKIIKESRKLEVWMPPNYKSTKKRQGIGLFRVGYLVELRLYTNETLFVFDYDFDNLQEEELKCLPAVDPYDQYDLEVLKLHPKWIYANLREIRLEKVKTKLKCSYETIDTELNKVGLSIYNITLLDYLARVNTLQTAPRAFLIRSEDDLESVILERTLSLKGTLISKQKAAGLRKARTENYELLSWKQWK